MGRYIVPKLKVRGLDVPGIITLISRQCKFITAMHSTRMISGNEQANLG